MTRIKKSFVGIVAFVALALSLTVPVNAEYPYGCTRVNTKCTGSVYRTICSWDYCSTCYGKCCYREYNNCDEDNPEYSSSYSQICGGTCGVMDTE